jgi:hypothetical protein
MSQLSQKYAFKLRFANILLKSRGRLTGQVIFFLSLVYANSVFMVIQSLIYNFNVPLRKAKRKKFFIEVNFFDSFGFSLFKQILSK